MKSKIKRRNNGLYIRIKPRDRIRKFLNAAARLIPEFSDVSSSIDFHYYYDNPLALLDVFTERFTKTADAKERKNA